MNLKIIARKYTNIYQELGIDVGTQITISNNSSHDIRLFSDETEPKDDSSYLLLRPTPFTAKNDSGDKGAWAFCNSNAIIDVKVE